MAIEFAGADTSDSTITTLTAGASIGTKNTTYVELISSTARASKRLTVRVGAINSKEHFQIFLATGAASSESDFISFTFWSGAAASGGGAQNESFDIPCDIASSVRLSATCSSSLANSEVQISVALSDDDGPGTSSQRETIGITGANDGFMGTDVDPGGTANTKPSGWTEISASTSHDYDMLLVSVGMSDNNALANGSWLIDIGTGAASSEVTLIEDIFHQADSFESGNQWYIIRAPITSGTRVVAKCQSTIIDSNDRLIDISIVGINWTAPAGGGATQTSYGYFG